MREIPMLFSTPLVQAILAGRKTQTRRPVTKPRITGGYLLDPELWELKRPGVWSAFHSDANEMVEIPCPICQPGDLLYVRECWAADCIHDGTAPNKIQPTLLNDRWYRADGESDEGRRGKWRPSIHMPRWAARIFLRVTDVRVERVQDITASAAVAEGARFFDEGSLEPCCFGGRGPGWSMGDPKSFGETLGSARMAFANAWIALYGQEAWDANQWVWAISFERVETPAREGGR